MNPREMRQARAVHLWLARELVNKGELEGRGLSDEENTQFESMMDGGDELLKRAERMERMERIEGIDMGETLPHKPDPEPKIDDEKRFESLGEQLRSIATAGSPGGAMDERLEMRAASGMNEGVPSEGGFLVQTDYASELIKAVNETGVLVPKCKKIPIGAGSTGLKMNASDETDRADGSRWGGILAYWKSEAAAKVSSKPKVRQIELKLKKLIGLCYATDELMEDATALEGVIREGFAEEFGFQLDDAVIEGTGAGMPLGILNAPCLVSQAKEAGQAAATIVAENIEKMYARVPARSLKNAVWLINQECWPQLFQLSHAVGVGGVPVFVPAGGLSQAPFGTLFGRPIEPIEQASALGTVGDIILADFSQYLMIDKGGVQSASSIHVRFVYDESVFRFVYRVDGQPIPSNVLTPFKGTATLSPFVTLATRA